MWFLTEVKYLVQLEEGLGKGSWRGWHISRVLNGEEVADVMRLGKGIHVKTRREIRSFWKNCTQSTLLGDLGSIIQGCHCHGSRSHLVACCSTRPAEAASKVHPYSSLQLSAVCSAEQFPMDLKGLEHLNCVSVAWELGCFEFWYTTEQAAGVVITFNEAHHISTLD